MQNAILFMLFVTTLFAQTPKLIDAHVHHNGELAFLKRLVARLEQLDGVGFLLTRPQHLTQVTDFIAGKPSRLIGFGDISLDDPHVLEQIDRFHQAGFRGLGEISRTRKPFDDPSYTPIYDRAASYGMILLFHTGIVNRANPETSEDVSSDRLRVTLLDNIARRYPKITIIAAHLGNPDYAWAAELGRWNPNLFFDVSGSTLIKKREDLAFFKSIFWWSNTASPHTPSTQGSAFEKLVFGSDVFAGELEELDRSIDRYQSLLNTCGVPRAAQANIFGGTLWRILNRK